MAQAQFAHADWPESPPCNRAGDNGSPAVSLSLFADRAHVRATLCEDAEAAGLRIADARDLAALNDGAVRALGDVVMVDCPQVGGAELAALARLDMRAAHTGAQLVVSTSVDALDDVFGCLDQSGAQILVDPSRAERIVALGRALADAPGQQVRELAAYDRITLIRLTEQVSRIAERLERLSASAGEAVVQSPRGAFALASNPDGDRLVAPPPAALPEPRVIRTMLRHRQARARFFDAELFADPAWDMLLDLTAARAEKTRVSVTSLCIASGVPATTALRWIAQMTASGLFIRVEDRCDRRRAFIALSDGAADGMARYFEHVGAEAGRLV